jgi:hypothetical protein
MQKHAVVRDVYAVRSGAQTVATFTIGTVLSYLRG